MIFLCLSILTSFIATRFYLTSMPHYLLELPYLFYLFSERVEHDISLLYSPSKVTQALCGIASRLTKPIVVSIYFSSFQADQISLTALDAVVFAVIFYSIPFSFWSKLKSNRTTGIILSVLDGLGTADLMRSLVLHCMEHFNLLHFLAVLTLSNAIEQFAYWFLFKLEGSTETLLTRLQNVKGSLFVLGCNSLVYAFFLGILPSFQDSNIFTDLNKTSFSILVNLTEEQRIFLAHFVSYGVFIHFIVINYEVNRKQGVYYKFAQAKLKQS